MHEIQLISPQIWPTHNLTMESVIVESKALNIIIKISETKLQWAYIQYILLKEEKDHVL